MIPEDVRRASRLLISLEWRDPDSVVQNANAWYDRNRAATGRVKTSQWEWLRRMGEDAHTLAAYRTAVDRALNKGGRAVAAGAAQPERRWRPAELADLLLAELVKAAEPDQSLRMEEFERHVHSLPSEEQALLREQDRLRAARTFVETLVTRIRADRALEASKR